MSEINAAPGTAFQRVLIRSDDQEVVLTQLPTVVTDLRDLDYYVSDDTPVRCPSCDRRPQQRIDLSPRARLWECVCQHRFLEVDEPGEAERLYEQKKECELFVLPPNPAKFPNMYERAADANRQALWNLEGRRVVSQASAFLTYGMVESAMQTLTEFTMNFERQYGLPVGVAEASKGE